MIKRSSRLVVLGTVSLVLGVFCLLYAAASTFTSVLTLEGILFCVGLAQIAYGIQGKQTGQLWPHTGLGCLAVACSMLIAFNPPMNPLAVSMLLGFFLLSGGLAKVIGAVMERTTGWGWFAFNGAVSLILGGLLLYTFPYSSKWTLGAFIGVDLIFAGASLIGLGITIRNAKKDVIADLRSMLPETSGEADRKRHGSDHDPESSPHLH